MKVKPVSTPQDVSAFLSFPEKVHQNNPAYIRPLNKDVEFVFDQKKNKYFKHGECERWLLWNENNEVIGRVAAFVNDKYTNQYKATGGMGFFDCINDKKAAFFLFDTCKSWLEKRGMLYMDGPINFGEKDKFWGLTTENFKKSPYYGQNYTPEYYVSFFKEYGFQTFYSQLIYTRDTHSPLQNKFQERADELKKDPKFYTEYISKRNLAKYTEDFRIVYNQAWGKREGNHFKGMNKTQSESIMKALKPIMDEDLCIFAYYDEKPIGFYISLPEVNEIFKYLKGKLGWWQKLRFITMLKTGKCKTAIGLAFGIAPEFQGKGVEGLLFDSCNVRIKEKKKYDNILITWIGSFNVKMVSIIESLGGEICQKMETLRCPFNKDEIIEQHTIN